MPPRYLLDTNTASYIIKGNIPRVRERLLTVHMSQILISAVTEAELLFGAARKREAVRLKTLPIDAAQQNTFRDSRITKLLNHS